MKASAVILAGGSSSRLGQNKALVNLAGKPLICHVFEKVKDLVDEIIVVLSSRDQEIFIRKVLKGKIKITVDQYNRRSPLIGAFSGLEATTNEYTLLLPCDAPLISQGVLLFLIDVILNIDAVIPRWPNGYIEPLQAVYKTKAACEAARRALNENFMSMHAMINLLRKVRYISTLVLEKINPGLTTFFNVNTPEDLELAELLLMT